MKKHLNYATLLIVLMMSIALYTGCDSDDNNPTGASGDLTGTWVLTSVTLSGPNGYSETFEPSQLYMSMTFVLNADGTYTGTRSGWDEPSASSGTWSAADGILTLNDSQEGSDSVPYTLDGNQLTLSHQEYEPDGTLMTYDLTFTKQ